MEQLGRTISIPELYSELTQEDPKLVSNFVPDKASGIQQRNDFLSGRIHNPDHYYNKLEMLDLDATRQHITEIDSEIASHDELNPKYANSYHEFIDRYMRQLDMMDVARQFKAAHADEERKVLKDEYTELNIELYGQPQESVYRSLIQEKLQKIEAKLLSESAQKIKKELLELVEYNPNTTPYERFTPTSETVEWMHDVVETLYGGVLSHIPEDQEVFTAPDVKAIFTEAIEEEFGEAARDWCVDIEPAKAVSVKTSEKRIVIPEDMNNATRDSVRKLMVHEVGVHVMRSIMGAQTDLLLLQSGLEPYYDAEEGLGVVMEQALEGKFSERGVDHYVTVGLAYFEQKDFRDVFETKWRLSLLEAIDESADVTEAAIEKAKGGAYSATMRIDRGTDELPWFKDLAYYNGAIDMWRHLETIRGDDLKFMFVLLGKADPSNVAHERIMYETKTI